MAKKSKVARDNKQREMVARYAERIYVMYGGHMMETSTCKEIFHHTEHPYTRALLRAIPRLDDAKNRILIPIDGLPPVPSQRPEYCPFYARCEYRCDRCLKHTDATLPDARGIGGGRGTPAPQGLRCVA